MDINSVQVRMHKVFDVVKGDLSTIRTGRATPALVEHIVVSVYGGSTKLKVMELATIAVSDPQTILLTPFDASIINEIQKGIMEANVGLTPTVDGQHIRISIPPLSQERREQLIKMMHQKLESGRIMARQIRHEAMAEIRKQFLDKAISEDDKTRFEKDVQKVTDDTIAHIEEIGKRKETELLEI